MAKMEQLLNFQDDLYQRILKARSNFKKTPKDRLTKEYIEGRLETVENLWSEFLSGHKELMRTQSSDALKASLYIKNETYDSCDELVLDYKTELKTKLSKFSVPNVNSDRMSTSDKATVSVKLPKVNINTFSGKCYSEWTTFRDLFCSLIHKNGHLDNVQKLLYLKGYLTGEAELLLSNIPITQDNYVRAWDLLEERYDNKKYISHQILDRLLGQRNLAHESASGLKEILDTTNDCLAALSNVGVKTENWDILVIHIVARKLDPESKRQWEFSVANISDDSDGSSDGHGNTSGELPTYKQFQKFLTKRYRALEFLNSGSISEPKKYGRPTGSVNKTRSMHITKTQCSYCSEEHILSHCAAFKKISVDSRRNFVQSNYICFCCLGGNHTARNCKKMTKCHVCMQRHHTLLHPESVKVNDANHHHEVLTSKKHASESALSSSSDCGMMKKAAPSIETVPVVSCFTHKHNPILLPTALVNIKSRNGQWFTIRTLLDQGSQSSFVTEATVQLLGLKKTSTKVQINGIGGNKALVSKATVTLNVSSRIDPQVVITVKAYVLKSITTLLPMSNIEEVKWQELQGIVLADPSYHTPSHVDVLLGADVYGEILQEGVKKGPQGSPIAQRTSLGWILSGKLNAISEPSEIKVMHILEDNDFVKRFWELEDDVSMSKGRLFIEEEKRCEEIFSNTTVQDQESRDIVRLQFKGEDPVVEKEVEKLKIPEKRLLVLERRLKHEDLKQKKVYNEYVELNRMELVPSDEGKRYPAAAKAVLSQFYMHDRARCENVEDGINSNKELNSLVEIEIGGFSLERWTSNSEELIQEMRKIRRKRIKKHK